MLKKKFMKFGVVVALVGSLFVSTTSMAATFKAKTYDEVVKIYTEQGVKRSSEFTIKFKGSNADYNRLIEDDYTFYYSALSMYDDPSIADDSDYLAGILDCRKGQGLTYTTSGPMVLTYTPRYFETRQQTDYVNQQTQIILDELGVASMSNYDKVKTIHDYVVRLIKYTLDLDNASGVYNAYTQGIGLCNSYALCMSRLLNTAGVPCKWISGKAGTGRDAGGHAWNIVELGDKWYYLDATWDDPDNGDQINYGYFLKGTQDFDSYDPNQIHTVNNDYYKTDFFNKYPMSQYAFVPGSNDQNTTVVTTPVNQDDSTTDDSVAEGYDFSQIFEDIYPSKGTLKIDKGYSDSIQFIINQDYRDIVDTINCDVISGKNKVKIVDNAFYDEYGYYYTNSELKGVRYGNAKVRITFILSNGQSKSYNFKVKVW